MSRNIEGKLFFITGVSAGFGRAFSKGALEAGHRVVGTVKNPQHVASFEALAPGNTKAVILDVTDTAAIAPTVAKVENEIGPIDFLVNNAGYGLEGILEEASLDEVRHQFEVNVFGVIARRSCRSCAAAAPGTSSMSPPWVA